MPIINKNIQVVFGTGDISALIGGLNDRSSGVVQFTEIELRPIGEKFQTDIKKMGINDALVTFNFNSMKSA
ncbi:hypothetical protein MKZ20_01115 [Psychrobacillus sp. FSL K6-2684]|uniref:Uncharacterized protein n=1 Tax=Psychrobacillus faecigallinarum TaxID=2762235 RepID=A0ABR8RAI1_9BACI|nr:hypothetical protein [Psychrobacillus faecigallinarum]MBD7944755.1 hypothetical protein [Psychrobacillus faecigallinarum]